MNGRIILENINVTFQHAIIIIIITIITIITIINGVREGL